MFGGWKPAFPMDVSSDILKKPYSIFLILILLSSVASFSYFELVDAQSPEFEPNSRLAEYVVPGEFIVKLKSPIDRSQLSIPSAGIAKLGVPSIDRLNSEFAITNIVALTPERTNSELDKIFLFKTSLRGNELALVKRYASLPNVEYAEPNMLIELAKTPNDPSFSSLWGMHNTGQSGGTADVDIDAPEAWNTRTDSTIIVAVIDTGVDYTHPDLAANMWTNPGEIPGNNVDDDGNGKVDDVFGYDFINGDSDPMDEGGDCSSHGTHVSGTIGAAGNNGVGVAGINWNVKIMALKAFTGPTTGCYGSSWDAGSAIVYATNEGAKISSHSWRCLGSGCYLQHLVDAINYAHSNGALVIAAAGNDVNNNDINPAYPASYNIPNVISVAAIDRNDNLASFSNYGKNTVHLGAPGVDILSTVMPIVNPTMYASYSGTSMATPHVSGVAALVWSQFPNLTHLELKDRILQTTVPTSALQGTTITGGRLNVGNMMQTGDTTPPSAVTNLSVQSIDSGRATLSWTATGDDGNSGTALSYDLRYSTSTITNSNFDSAQKAGTPAPKPAGSTELVTVMGLNSQTTYYFALKVIDDAGNKSTLSNVVSGTTKKSISLFFDDVEQGNQGWNSAGVTSISFATPSIIQPFRTTNEFEIKPEIVTTSSDLEKDKITYLTFEDLSLEQSDFASAPVQAVFIEDTESDITFVQSTTKDTTPFYRSLGHNEHFYTISKQEWDNASTQFGYKKEGVCCTILDSSVVYTGEQAVPLFRSFGHGDHFYTISQQEWDNASTQYGYKKEGIAGYIFAKQVPKSVPLYRSLGHGDHFYTISKTEWDNASTQFGYTKEGIAGYVFPVTPVTLSVTPLPSSKVNVLGTSNVFLAGGNAHQNQFPAGGGTAPPQISFTTGAGTVFKFPSITGQTNCCAKTPTTNAEGTPASSNIKSKNGISGIVHHNRQMYLAGVFLSDSVPTSPAPYRLDFTGGSDEFQKLSPQLGQAFYIGNGKTDTNTIQEFVAPPGATRLYFGFLDAVGFNSNPGYYNDNTGAIAVDVLIAPPQTPSPKSNAYVLGTSNVFIANGNAKPNEFPAGGGTMPPHISFITGAGTVFKFPSMTGETNCCAKTPTTNAEGTPASSNIKSKNGISGIVHHNRQMYLAGVFLSDSVPVSAPPRLTFTNTSDEFQKLSPQLGQTF